MFIAIEGSDLIGKTTQVDMLARHLRGRGRAVASYSFPAYDSPAGEVISSHLRGEVMLSERRYKPAGGSLGSSGIAGCEEATLARSRHDSLVFQCLQLADKYAAAPYISASLRLGQTVVACRWWQSALVYGAESGLDEGWVRRTCHCLPRADVNVLLDLDPARARRRPGAPLDRLEADLAMQARVRRRYLDLWRSSDGGEHGFWAVVDAEGDADVVHGRILDVLEISGVYRPRSELSGDPRAALRSSTMVSSAGGGARREFGLGMGQVVVGPGKVGSLRTTMSVDLELETIAFAECTWGSFVVESFTVDGVPPPWGVLPFHVVGPTSARMLLRRGQVVEVAARNVSTVDAPFAAGLSGTVARGLRDA